MAKKSKSKHVKMPKGHPTYNLPDPQGGAFMGATPNGVGPQMPPAMGMAPGGGQGAMQNG